MQGSSQTVSMNETETELAGRLAGKMNDVIGMIVYFPRICQRERGRRERERHI